MAPYAFNTNIEFHAVLVAARLQPLQILIGLNRFRQLGPCCMQLGLKDLELVLRLVALFLYSRRILRRPLQLCRVLNLHSLQLLSARFLSSSDASH